MHRQQNQKIYVYPNVFFTEDDWVTYDLTMYPVGPIPGSTEASVSNCRITSAVIAASQSMGGTGPCAMMGSAMLEFDVPMDGQIGEDFIEGSKVFNTTIGTTTVEFAYRLRE